MPKRALVLPTPAPPPAPRPSPADRVPVNASAAAAVSPYLTSCNWGEYYTTAEDYLEQRLVAAGAAGSDNLQKHLGGKCSPCPRERYMFWRHHTHTSCAKCPAGKHQPLPGQHFCYEGTAAPTPSPTALPTVSPTAVPTGACVLKSTARARSPPRDALAVPCLSLPRPALAPRLDSDSAGAPLTSACDCHSLAAGVPSSAPTPSPSSAVPPTPIAPTPAPIVRCNAGKFLSLQTGNKFPTGKCKDCSAGE
jgi:hypothetical protein